MFNSITIKFQTAPTTPPPFSHFYTITLTENAGADKALKTKFELIYTDRVGFDADEIEAEGFTQNDDYTWAGQLASVWTEELEKLLEKTKSFKPIVEKDTEDYLEVEVLKGIETRAGAPNNAAAWQYAAQELVQAIYETAGRERPFDIELLRISNRRSILTKYSAVFATRHFTKTITANGKTLAADQPWESLENVLKTMYTPDYFTDEAVERRPVEDGWYILQPDGLWYELDVAVLEPAGGSDALAGLQKLFS